MDSRLCVELGINNDGKFYAVDHSHYEEWVEEEGLDLNHVVYERLITYDGLDAQILTTTKHLMTDVTCLDRCTTIEIPGDGLYLYQKLVIPLKGHAGDSICYSDVNHIYLVDSEGERVVCFEEAFDKVKECRTLNSFWFDDNVFSIYNLIKCYLIRARNELNDYIKSNCGGACKNKGVSEADILFIAIVILKDLICKCDYIEAQRILNAISKCGGLCSNLKVRTVNCGCD